MSDATELRPVIVEREIAYPADKIWRALTQPHLIKEWLMNSDFKLELNHSFKFSEAWGEIECTVKTVEPNKVLAYSWSAFGLDSLVTFTLTPNGNGTTLRVEQVGFRPDQEQAYQGARQAWPAYLAQLEELLGRAG
ncbi:MAG: SRPBCC domain-containing protein [Devosia sp.]